MGADQTLARPGLIREDAHYQRAPIVEAIIQFRVDLPSDVGLDDLARLTSGSPDFLDIQPRYAVSSEVQISNDDVVGSATGQKIGFSFPRSDGARVIHAHLDRYVFSCLAPYDRWEVFEAEALEYWKLFIAVARPTAVVGASVRFINKIDVPSPAVEITDYLRTSVSVSPYLPQMLSQLFMQIEIPLSDGVAVAITSTLATPPNDESTSLILDIDARGDVHLDPAREGFNEELRAELAKLRSAKNFVFEACITDATRGLIK